MVFFLALYHHLTIAYQLAWRAAEGEDLPSRQGRLQPRWWPLLKTVLNLFIL